MLATYGVGQGIGTYLAGWVFDAVMSGASGAAALQHWQMFWVFPLAFALVVTAMFIFGFREETPAAQAAA